MGAVERSGLRERRWRWSRRRSSPPIRTTPSPGCSASPTHDRDLRGPVAPSGRHGPFVRELHLGLGCAIENALLAAGPNGYDAAARAGTGFADRISPPQPCAGARRDDPARPARRAAAPDPLYQTIPAASHQPLRLPIASGRCPPDWLESARTPSAGTPAAGCSSSTRTPTAAASTRRWSTRPEAIIADDTDDRRQRRWFRGLRGGDRAAPRRAIAGGRRAVAGTAGAGADVAVSPASAHDGWLSQTATSSSPPRRWSD